jgi:uncharacterized protein (DUF1778 family)
MVREAHTTTARDQAINIRVSRQQRDLIDQAAQALGKSRSDFMLEIACREAEHVLLDKVLFHLEPDAFARFNKLLDTPPSTAALSDLLATTPPWE